ncbi:hypothetical protein ElyMa_006741200 [Elysia marginata]|uniref:Uncharacterized protein n=1 Tax=Elysia marginata TaxID=1093978 RepID=A0AAV4IYG4_9GAST|nr:hypothetical protein ElyMa_006741200 [Elysia marginata]
MALHFATAGVAGSPCQEHKEHPGYRDFRRKQQIPAVPGLHGNKTGGIYPQFQKNARYPEGSSSSEMAGFGRGQVSKEKVPALAVLSLRFTTEHDETSLVILSLVTETNDLPPMRRSRDGLVV